MSLPEELLESLSTRFLTGLYEAAAAGHPGDMAILAELADLYARQGLYERSLETDEELVAAEPENPVFRYNLACSLSALGRIDRAFEALEKALELGYEAIDEMRSDPDLENLRKDRRWSRLLSRFRERRTAR
ncbi:MAG: TPR end-of-group domain-containing protein [Planctomycetota bacterium]